ncbi:MAG TPA: hypothetical protein VH234_05830 [Candidatus Saccharimonadales bacterium]|jgi:hypothetical protein|nr:hypothetical protein [Candidatus Saccharimonadales bacterium]
MSELGRELTAELDAAELNIPPDLCICQHCAGPSLSLAEAKKAAEDSYNVTMTCTDCHRNTEAVGLDSWQLECLDIREDRREGLAHYYQKQRETIKNIGPIATLGQAQNVIETVRGNNINFSDNPQLN